MAEKFNAFEEFMNQCENKKAFAKEIGITRQRLFLWRRCGVPWEKIGQISEKTGISNVSLILETFTKRYGEIKS